MELYIAGGCSEHGRNCFLVKGEGISFLVDAGLMKEKEGSPYPVLKREEIEKLDYLFLTHSHSDHVGAIPWLYENGFHGTVAASQNTFAMITAKIGKRLILEELGSAGKKIRLGENLTLKWGRSGHCAGSVWYRFVVDDTRILFTGDYAEHSLAYRCDRIRRMKADLAVVDCAYGNDSGSAKKNRRAFLEYAEKCKEKGTKLFFPIPSNGRGLDILRAMGEVHIPSYLGDHMQRELKSIETPEFWLKEGLMTHLTAFETQDLKDGIRELERNRKKSLALLVTDSQLYDQENRDIAVRMQDLSGRVCLTGKQNPTSFSRALLVGGRADFIRLFTHQNSKEMKKLISRNEFGYVIPYHCRQVLSFDEKNILVLKTGDRVRLSDREQA